MKFEGISFNDKHLKGMSRHEFDANVAHHFLPCCREKIQELFNIINGHDQKPAGQLEAAQSAKADTDELIEHTA